MPVSQFRNYTGTLSYKADTRSSATVAGQGFLFISTPAFSLQLKEEFSLLTKKIPAGFLNSWFYVVGCKVMHQRFIGDGRFLSTQAVGIYCKERLPVNHVMLQEKKNQTSESF